METQTPEQKEEIEDMAELNEVKEKKWEHLPCRPATFADFRLLKEEAGCKSDDEMLKQLIKSFKGLE